MTVMFYIKVWFVMLLHSTKSRWSCGGTSEHWVKFCTWSVCFLQLQFWLANWYYPNSTRYRARSLNGQVSAEPFNKSSLPVYFSGSLNYSCGVWLRRPMQLALFLCDLIKPRAGREIVLMLKWMNSSNICLHRSNLRLVCVLKRPFHSDLQHGHSFTTATLTTITFWNAFENKDFKKILLFSFYY